MSLFCPGVSWGRRRERRKALTRGASLRKGTAVRRGLSTNDLTASTGSQNTAGVCGCVQKRKDQSQSPDTNCSHGSDAFAGIYLGPANNNNKECSSEPGIDSVLYFDDSLCAQYGSSTNTARSSTPFEPTPEKANQPQLQVLEEKSNNIFIPNWVRHRRYLPTADDVDIDQIDAISLHTLAGSTVDVTPERLKSLVSDSSSPIYQNLVDQELSDLYLQAQMNGLCYTSTPAKMSLVNVVNPQVMTASSQTPPAIHRTRVGILQHTRQVHQDSMRRDSISVSSNDASHTMTTPNKLNKSNRPSSPQSRVPLRQLSSNTPPFPLTTSRVARQRHESGTSIYDNLPQNNGEENQPGLPQRSVGSAKKRAHRKTDGSAKKKSDFRKKALMRNFSYKPIQEQDVDQLFVNSNSNQSARRLAARKPSAKDVIDKTSTSKLFNVQTPHSPRTLHRSPNSDLIEDFDALTLDKEIIMPSCKELIDEITSHSEPESGNTRRVNGRIIRKPKYADNSVRQARVVLISPNSSSSSECDNGVLKSEAFGGTSRSELSHSSKAAKLGSSWSFVCPASNQNFQSIQYAKPSQHGQMPPQVRRTSATNLRTIQNRLSHQPKRKIRNNSIKPRQIDIIPEEVEPGDYIVETVTSPPFTPSISQRRIPSGKEPCAKGLILFDFAKQSNDDVSVHRGENVTVLDMQDEDWIYVQLDDEVNTPGFVPRSFVFITPLIGAQATNNSPTLHEDMPAASLDDIKIQSSKHEYENLPSKKRQEIKPADANNSAMSRRKSYKQAQLNNIRVEKQRRTGPSDRYMTLVETYVVTRDHFAQQIDELNVKTGDIVFINSKQQREGDIRGTDMAGEIDWMWVLVAGTGRTGYIPAFAAAPVDFQSSCV